MSYDFKRINLRGLNCHEIDESNHNFHCDMFQADFIVAKDTSANRFYGITGPVRAASKIIKATYIIKLWKPELIL